MVSKLGSRAYLKAVVATDDAFVYDVFCTTWESEVAALPNPNLARHVLRIQHIAQERRFAARYPHHERFVVLDDGRPVGRLYAVVADDTLHLIDLTLMPEHRSHGLGTAIIRDLLAHAREEGLTLALQVPRQNRRATDLVASLGFALSEVDDLDLHFVSSPTSTRRPRRRRSSRSSRCQTAGPQDPPPARRAPDRRAPGAGSATSSSGR